MGTNESWINTESKDFLAEYNLPGYTVFEKTKARVSLQAPASVVCRRSCWRSAYADDIKLFVLLLLCFDLCVVVSVVLWCRVSVLSCCCDLFSCLNNKNKRFIDISRPGAEIIHNTVQR